MGDTRCPRPNTDSTLCDARAHFHMTFYPRARRVSFCARRRVGLNSRGALAYRTLMRRCAKATARIISSSFARSPPSHFPFVTSWYKKTPPRRRKECHNPSPITTYGARKNNDPSKETTHLTWEHLKNLYVGTGRGVARYPKASRGSKNKSNNTYAIHTNYTSTKTKQIQIKSRKDRNTTQQRKSQRNRYRTGKIRHPFYPETTNRRISRNPHNERWDTQRWKWKFQDRQKQKVKSKNIIGGAQL